MHCVACSLSYLEVSTWNPWEPKFRYIDHGFVNHNEADLFLADISVLGEHDEQEATVTDQNLMLADPDCDMGNLVC